MLFCSVILGALTMFLTNLFGLATNKVTDPTKAVAKRVPRVFENDILFQLILRERKSKACRSLFILNYLKLEVSP